MELTRFMTNWIWTPDWTTEDNNEARVIYFRKTFALAIDKMPDNWQIRISADSRYKLRINGVFVQEGPQKPTSLAQWPVDTVDISPYIHDGENVISAEVLRYPATKLGFVDIRANDSMLRTEQPNLFVEDIRNGSLSGKTGWKCCVNRGIRIVGTSDGPIHALEDAAIGEEFHGWHLPGYDDTQWQDAAPKLYFDLNMAIAPANQVPRQIPPMLKEDRRFEQVAAVRTGDAQMADRIEKMLHGLNSVEFPPHTTHVVEISAGAEENGYLIYRLAGGADAKITTLCSECYGYSAPEGKPQRKGDRTDAANGELAGHSSVYTVGGYGTQKKPETYEPFWFRTFRYIRLTIETSNEPLTFLDFSYRATGYPLDVKTKVETSDPDFAAIWDISVRTLRLCMHETYFDCPFYEQFQYAMDSRSEILYTYAISADDRLARQAIEAFRCSQRPDGLICADAPSSKGVIPGFAIYYILMVHDHMMYFGDQRLVKENLPAIDRVLQYFENRLTAKGLVGAIGGRLFRHPYWSFIDWADKWNAGVPAAAEAGDGSITMESMLYLYGLQKAADLAAYVGRSGLAGEYRERAEKLCENIRRFCTGRDGLIQDGPGVEDYSVHCQTFAVLTDMVTPEEGKKLLQACIGNSEMAQATVAFRLYLFRALEKCGWYEKTDELWDTWRQMLRDNLSTCAESDTEPRSDCHAWASLILYELPSAVLGVRPAAPGFSKVQIDPKMGALTWARGNVVTPKGMVSVQWKKTADGRCDLEYTLPEGMTVENAENRHRTNDS